MTTYVGLPEALAIGGDMGLHVRDLGLLSSALSRPESSMFGVDAYPDLFVKSAALLSSLAQNHPLFDGNKRFSWVCTLTFLELNGVLIDTPTDDAFRLVLDVAQSRVDLEAIASAFRDHSTD